MKCEKAREIILTDYIDGEASESMRQEVDEHLKNCPECSRLLSVLRQRVSGPVGATLIERPPESVWQSIKERVSDAENIPVREILSEKISFIIRYKKPVLAAVTAAVLFFVAVGVYTGNSFLKEKAIEGYFEDQIYFLYSLDNGNGDESFYPDMGIPQEDILL